jgi:hypothetical protein
LPARIDAFERARCDVDDQGQSEIENKSNESRLKLSVEIDKLNVATKSRVISSVAKY